MSQPADAAYSEGALRLALAVASRTHSPAADGSGWEAEPFRTIEDLREVLDEQGWARVRPAVLTTEDLAVARHLHGELRSVFTSASADPPGAIAALDRLLAGAAPRVRVRASPLGVRVELGADAHASLATQLTTALPVAVARAAERHGLARLRICASAPATGPACRSAFIDTSRNGAKRFCRPQCANRTHVAAFRRRGTGPTA